METERKEDDVGVPDVLVEIDVSFPPKKVRTAKGVVGKREKAVFNTALAQELGLIDQED